MKMPCGLLAGVSALLLACLLQGCASAPTQADWNVQPLLRIDDSPGQTAASYYALGRYHQQRGEMSLADAAFARSLALDPRQLDARNAQALLMSEQDRPDDARSAFEQLVKDFPDQAQPHNNLGYLLYLRGDYTAALTQFTLARSLDPDNRRVRANLALLHAATGGLEIEQPAYPAAPALVADIALINGNGRPGMGQTVKELLARRGLLAGRVLNQRHFTQDRTVIEYLADHAMQAGLVRDALAGHAVLVERSTLPGDIGIRLVLGRDLPPSTGRAGKEDLAFSDRAPAGVVP